MTSSSLPSALTIRPIRFYRLFAGHSNQHAAVYMTHRHLAVGFQLDYVKLRGEALRQQGRYFWLFEEPALSVSDGPRGFVLIDGLPNRPLELATKRIERLALDGQPLDTPAALAEALEPWHPIDLDGRPGRLGCGLRERADRTPTPLGESGYFRRWVSRSLGLHLSLRWHFDSKRKRDLTGLANLAELLESQGRGPAYEGT